MSSKNATILLAAIVLTGSMGLKTVLGAHSSDTILMANGSAPPPAPWNGSAPPPAPWKDTLTAMHPLQNGSAPPPAPWNGSAPPPAPWKDTVTAVRPLQNGSAPPPAPWMDTLTGRSQKSW